MPYKPTPEFAIYGPITAYSKEYPTFTRLISYEHSIKVRESGYEAQREALYSHRQGVTNPLTLIDSIRRSKKELADLTLCNDFDLFVTFTFATHRQNITKCKTRMSKWLKNQKDLHGKFNYLIVPEFHKDGKSLHFHALINKFPGKLNFSGIVQNHSRVYNLPSYRIGFTNATHIKDKSKLSNYIRKYITKDMPKFDGKKRYWCSTGLIRPIVTPNPTIDPWTRQKFIEVYRHKQLSIHQLNGTLPKPINNNEETIKWQTHHKT